MSKDYAIPASPGIARRLVKLADMSNVVLDDRIRTLANRGRIPDGAADALFASSDIAINVDIESSVQSLVDNRLRGLLLTQTTEPARRTVLAAAHFSEVKKIIIATDHDLTHWTRLAIHLGLTCGSDPIQDTDILFVTFDAMNDRNVVETRRDALLVIESVKNPLQMQRDVQLSSMFVLQEVSRTIIIARMPLASWVASNNDETVLYLAQMLTPDVPPALFAHPRNYPARALHQRGFMQSSRAKIYDFLGIVTDLLGSCAPKD